MTGAPPIAVTPGDPAGIGPDLVVAAARRPWPFAWVALGDPDTLAERAARLGLDLRLVPWHPGEPVAPPAPGELRVWPHRLPAPARPGKPAASDVRSTLEALDHAVDGCLAGRLRALVTGPLNKALVNAAGIPFTGHTEYLAARAGGNPVMMLTTPGLRVALATTHLPLAEVPAAITRERLRRTLEVLDRDLRERFGIPAPRILVCGLNPHAGEDGHLGREELDVIRPVLRGAAADGMRVTGPVPADTAFVPHRLSGCDAVLAMYHDQGLPVLKHMGFGRAVNVTLGLPLVRTSVDHGTAYELAGTGRAETGSFEAALELAAALARGGGTPGQRT
jgi:4-hydroxythreonine-4-phosphate dehydrogenase